MSTINATQLPARDCDTKHAESVIFSDLTHAQKVQFIEGVRAAARLLRSIETFSMLGDNAPCDILQSHRSFGANPKQVLLFGRTLNELAGNSAAIAGFDAAMTDYLFNIETSGVPYISYYELLQADDLELLDMEDSCTVREMQVKNAGLSLRSQAPASPRAPG